jgi:uncharacterized protein (DUF2237 family)
MKTARNVLGEDLEPCCFAPVTGYLRNGHCDTGPQDLGVHTVCAQMTAEFLAFSKARGNDLTTPMPELRFPGLRAGTRWCLCAQRWKEAYDAGVAPPVILSATHEATLVYVPLEALKRHALDLA